MFEIDESEWPIVTGRWKQVLTDDDVERFFSSMEAWLARGERFGLLLDSRGATGDMTLAQRARVLKFMRAKAEQSGPLLVQAIVHDQPVHRALYAVVSRIFPLPFPSKTFPEPESARLWLSDKLASQRR